MLEYIDRALDHAQTLGSHVVLARDFNVHNAAWLMSNKTTKAGELAEDICHLHGLEQHVHIPTRGPNTLDLILSDFPGNVTVTGHPPLGASDHICLLAIIPAPALRERPPSELSGGTNRRTGTASATLIEQVIGSLASQTTQINPASMFPAESYPV